MGLLKKRKGSAVVEAAVVLPVILLSVMAVIYILIFVYNEVASSSKVHVAANAEMGKQTGVSITQKHIPHGVGVTEGNAPLGRAFYADQTVRFRRTGILRNSFTREIRTYTYKVDERKLIRYADFFDGE